MRCFALWLCLVIFGTSQVIMSFQNLENKKSRHTYIPLLNGVYGCLKSESASKRSSALRFLFEHKASEVDRMNVVLSINDDLYYLGKLKKCVESYMFGEFAMGNFMYDDRDVPGYPWPRLLLTCKHLPHVKNYFSMIVPERLARDFSDTAMFVLDESNKKVADDSKKSAVVLNLNE